VRAGVRRGSRYHLTEYFGPILGVMTAETLEEAISIQNEIDYGLTAGLHSLDPEELELWVDTIQAGNLYINRGITGAIVQRQPFGGWKKSAVGPGTKAGGPNYLMGLGEWQNAAATVDPAGTGATVHPGVQALLDAAMADKAIDGAELASLRRALRSDANAWDTEFGTSKDVSGLTAERNVFRYCPLPVTVRLSEGESLASLVRVVSAGVAAGSVVTVSSALRMPEALTDAAAGLGIGVTVEDDVAWLARVAGRGAFRIRLIGGSTTALAEALGGRPDVAVYAHQVTEAGRVEILPFLHEQAISITAHRFGTPNPLSDHLFA
jgi:RHH-type proline utilization regulon transcriptional repressor/proline dehydrogenase/delta 1-pyrroline-5-carboxylate dehydrogenase